MNFVQWLNSLDEFLYELMSWLVFYPLTLWRILRHPLTTMRYAEDQLRLEQECQYRATVSPPVMLILTIVLIQGLGLAVDGSNAIIGRRHGLASLVDDNTTLLFLRLALFGTFALVLAARKVHRSAEDLDRDTLKPAFYAQCYAISPFALLLGGGLSAAAHFRGEVQLAGLAAILAAFLFYGIVQIRWFRQALRQSAWRSFLDASIGMIVSIAATVTIALLFA
ncbi:hypothetical protein [Novosphingobium lindaniclasticum]|uniref:Permease n=1 Tax=Novosphingobium lindaniclasticum LE124 TaxID=1096930 RepID=T0H3W7_9SPHN|nr:hypothetical protein [Novosphingobium lindaniclasticum]EQB07652.1 hypothetical protein L284_22600 [Novosphingobium lindaniclasticum LE124]